MQRRNRFSEKVVENCLRDHPEAFLGEKLELLHQQYRMDGFAPDLIFRRSDGGVVIVEVQLGRLDRYHLYKTIEYRDLFIQRSPDAEVQLVLIAEEPHPRYSTMLRTHSIDLRVFSREQLEELVDRHGTDTADLDVDKHLNASRLSVRRLLRLLTSASNVDDHRSTTMHHGTIVTVWPQHVSEIERRHVLSLRVPADDPTAWSASPMLLPQLCMFSNDTLALMTPEISSTLRAWCRMANQSIDNVSRILLSDAATLPSDALLYRSEHAGRLKNGFYPLATRYGQKKGWNTQLIRDDFERFGRLGGFRGVNGSLSLRRVFQDVRIHDGPGPCQTPLETARDRHLTLMYGPCSWPDRAVRTINDAIARSCCIEIVGFDYFLAEQIAIHAEVIRGHRDIRSTDWRIATQPMALERIDEYSLELACRYLPSAF